MADVIVNQNEADHVWVHEHLAAYLAGGLESAERERLDAHINGCPACFDAFSEARDADRAIQRMAGGFSPDAGFEERMTQGFRRQTMKGWRHPVVRYGAYATAAALALAATGVFANFALRQGGPLNNPVSQMLAAKAEKDAPELSGGMDLLYSFGKDRTRDLSGNRAATAPATVTSGSYPGVNPAARMQFVFKDASIDTVLNEIANKFGVAVIKSQSVTGKVTINVPEAVSVDQAVRLLNSILVPMGYSTLSMVTPGPASEQKTVLRVVAMSEAKKSLIPVKETNKAEDIPNTEELMTVIIPLKNVDATQLRNDLMPVTSLETEITSNRGANSIVVTDTASKIRRLLEITSKLDESAGAGAKIEHHQLANGDARDAAVMINSLYTRANEGGQSRQAPRISQNSQTGGGLGGGSGFGGGGGGFGGGTGLAPGLAGRVIAQGDARTNTVVLNGPPAQVDEALKLLKDREKSLNGKSFTSTLDVTGGALDLQTASAADKYSKVEDFNEIIRRQGSLSAREGQTGRFSVGAGASPSSGTDFGLQGNGGQGASRGGAAGGGSGKLEVMDGNLANVGAGYMSYGDAPVDFTKLTPSPDSFYTDASRMREAAGLTKAGTSNLTLSGTGTYSGGSATVNGGTIAYDRDAVVAPGDFSGAGGMTVAQGAAVTTGGITINGGWTNNGTQVVTGSGAAGASKALGSPVVTLIGGGGAGLEKNAVVNPNVTVTNVGAVVMNGGTMTTTAGRGRGAAPTPVTNIAGGQAVQFDSTGGALNTATISGASVVMNAGTGYASASPAAQPAAASFSGIGQVSAGSLRVTGSIDSEEQRLLKLVPDAVQQGTQDRQAQMRQVAQGPQGQPAGPQRGGTQPSGALPTPAPGAEISALKIIRNGNLQFEVLSFDEAYRTVLSVVQEERGFISSTSSDKLANGKVRGVIVVRVPPDRVEWFLAKIRGIGDLKAQQVAANDITKQYTDIESELRGLRGMETRLVDLIKSGRGEVKDLVEAEKQLGEYRIRIEKLEGEIRYYNNLVSMATITITAFEKDIATPTAASAQEVMTLNVETEEVEAKYVAARAILDDAKARIVESQLKNTDADHVAAHIVADVPPDKADFVAAQLRQLGKVASFNRDRKQTVTGGTGAPAPNVQVEQKDTRVTIDLYNLANLNPRETTVLRVAVRDVEATYREVINQVRRDAPAPAPAEGAAPAPARAVGRVVTSNLSGQQADQMAAEIRAMVNSDQADALVAAIRNSGEVLTSTVAMNQDAAGTTSAKRGLNLTLVNIASIPPREINSLAIAVRNVDTAYQELLTAIRRDAPPGGSPLLPPSVGRVSMSNINGQQPEQMSAEVKAEIRAEQADAILALLRRSGEVLNATRTETPEAANATPVKRGVQVRFVHYAVPQPREAQAIRGVTQDVVKAREALLAKLAPMSAAGDVLILSNQLRQPEARKFVAQLSLDVRREVLPAVDQAFRDAGIELYYRTIARSTDTANTLESKVRLQVDEIQSAESLEPRRTVSVAREVDDVQKAVEEVRTAAGVGAGGSARELHFTIGRKEDGHTEARLMVDVPVGDAASVLAKIRALGGTEKDSQVSVRNDVPDTSMSRERIDLTLMSKSAIVPEGKGVGDTLRAALSHAAAALIFSLYLVVTGLLFAAPFLIVLWVVWTLVKRRRRRVVA